MQVYVQRPLVSGVSGDFIPVADGSPIVTPIWQGTQAEYDLIQTPDPAVMYLITDSSGNQTNTGYLNEPVSFTPVLKDTSNTGDYTSTFANGYYIETRGGIFFSFSITGLNLNSGTKSGTLRVELPSQINTNVDTFLNVVINSFGHNHISAAINFASTTSNLIYTKTANNTDYSPLFSVNTNLNNASMYASGFLSKSIL